MDVGAWLRGLGLGQYEAAFRDNAIDSKVLPNLTPRIRGILASLWSAIAGGCSTPLPRLAPSCRRPLLATHRHNPMPNAGS
jgi:SAM domain (Sterile alpha motif)